jgi:hypothetical protein
MSWHDVVSQLSATEKLGYFLIEKSQTSQHGRIFRRINPANVTFYTMRVSLHFVGWRLFASHKSSHRSLDMPREEEDCNTY